MANTDYARALLLLGDNVAWKNDADRNTYRDAVAAEHGVQLDELAQLDADDADDQERARKRAELERQLAELDQS